MTDLLCNLFDMLSPIFDFVNSILSILGFELDFSSLFGCDDTTA